MTIKNKLQVKLIKFSSKILAFNLSKRILNDIFEPNQPNDSNQLFKPLDKIMENQI